MRTTTPKSVDLRFEALWRFALLITLYNLLGHAFLGFEPSWAQPLAALATAYSLALLFELVQAWSVGGRPPFLDGWRPLLNTLLPVHITAMAISMLLYSNERVMPIVFATAVALSSKVLFRAPLGEKTRHFMNPSNAGIVTTLLLFPWVGIAPPYQFTAEVDGLVDWAFPLVFILLGTYINSRYARRIPLVLGFLAGFVLQILVRSLISESLLGAGLLPMTGVAFLLFTFYMVEDPGTTPSRPRSQLLFGMTVATIYGLLMHLHIVFGFFFALAISCLLRGAGLYLLDFESRYSKGRSLGEVVHTSRKQ